jgi:hypothetical protein
MSEINISETKLSNVIQILSQILKSDPDTCERIIKRFDLQKDADNITKCLSSLKKKRNHALQKTLTLAVSDNDDDQIYEPPTKRISTGASTKFGDSTNESDTESIRTTIPDYDPFEQDLVEEIPKTKHIPKFVRWFNVDLFCEFVDLRKRLDLHIDGVINTRGIISNLKSEPDTFFDNKHLVAYFYAKLSEMIHHSDARIKFIQQLIPSLNLTKGMAGFKRWSTIVSHNSDYQWLAGISSRNLSVSTVANWQMALKHYDMKPLLELKEIDGHDYWVPKQKVLG